jgi:hypothetical protein
LSVEQRATIAVEVPMSSRLAEVVAAGTDAADAGAGPGLLGFLIVAGLGLALVVLYRSLRRQLGRIDFNAEATTDAERMRQDSPPDGDGRTP